MKPILLSCLLILAQMATAQTPGRTRFYVLNPGILRNPRLRTTLNPDKPIIIPNGSYTLFETDADSLKLLVGDEAQPFPFDAGKTYYFTVYLNHAGGLIISEVSERIFWLTANLNPVRKPLRYFLSKNGDLEQTQ